MKKNYIIKHIYIIKKIKIDPPANKNNTKKLKFDPLANNKLIGLPFIGPPANKNKKKANRKIKI